MNCKHLYLTYIIAAAKLFTVQNSTRNIAGPTKPIVVISFRIVKIDHL